MGLLRPTALQQRVTDLSPELLRRMGVSAILLDVDNTIASYTSHQPIPGAMEWAKAMGEAGFRLIIVSNNFKKRVGPFAARFGLDFISFACKPFPYGYLKARRRLGLRCRDCAIVGDQVFTDIVGANLCGMKSVLLTPIEPEEGFTFRRQAHRRRQPKGGPAGFGEQPPLFHPVPLQRRGPAGHGGGGLPAHGLPL